MNFKELEGFNLGNDEPYYIQISDILRDKIRTNELPLGKKLPSRIELSRILHVSKETVHEALQILSREGYVSGRTKHGTLVVSNNPVVKKQLNTYRNICVVFCLPPAISVEKIFFEFSQFMEFYGVGHVAGKKQLNLSRAIIKNNKLLYGVQEEKISGYILLGHITPKCLAIIRNLKLPFVVEGDILDKGELVKDIDIVTDDNFDKFFKATNHLVGLGHKKILYLNNSFDEFPWGKDAFNGYKKALTNAGITPDERLAMKITTYDKQQIYKKLKEYLNKPVQFTGIVSSEVSWCIAARKILLEKGLSIPDDISVVTTCNTGLFSCNFCYLKLVGIMAAERLIEKLNNPASKPKRTIVPNTFYDLGTTKKVSETPGKVAI